MKLLIKASVVGKPTRIRFVDDGIWAYVTHRNLTIIAIERQAAEGAKPRQYWGV
jgi:hypothetical protein